MTVCQCWNLTHGAYKCDKPATWECTKCGDKLCGACAKKHHMHGSALRKLS